MKNRFIIYIISLFLGLSFLTPLNGIPLWSLLSRNEPGPTATPVNHAVFDGSSYLRVSSASPTGLSDTQTGTVSFWIKPALDGTTMRVFVMGRTGVPGNRLIVTKSSTNLIVIQGYKADGSVVLDIRSTNTVLAASGWTHVMACWDLANASNRKIYINGVSETLTVTTYLNDTIDYYTATDTRVNVGCGNEASPTSFFSGGIAELWFDETYNDAIGDYYNAGKAIDLGVSGAVPTGGSPAYYFSANGNDNSWSVNSGTGGSLTRVGTLGSDVSPPTY